MKRSSPAAKPPARGEGRPHDRESEIEYLRANVRRRVEHTSRRQVAIEVGTTVGTIRNFADGKGMPHVRTLNLLRRWDLRTWAEGWEGVPAAAADRVVEAITERLPEGERRRARAQLIEVFAHEFERHRVAAPAWVVQLQHGEITRVRVTATPRLKSTGEG